MSKPSVGGTAYDDNIMGKGRFRETRQKGIPQDKPHNPSSPNSRRYLALRAVGGISHIAKRMGELYYE